MSIPAVLVSPYRDLPCALHAKLEPQAEDSPSTMGENLCASNMEDAHALNVEPDFAERERERNRDRGTASGLERWQAKPYLFNNMLRKIK